MIGQLTTRKNHPNEIHKEVIAPEIQKFWTRIGDLGIVVIEHASSIVEDQAVDLADADDDLEGVAERVREGDEVGYDEAEGAPCELCVEKGQWMILEGKLGLLGKSGDETGGLGHRN